MKNKSITLSFITSFSIIWLFLYSLPWASVLEFKVKTSDPKIKNIQLSFTHSNGEEITRNYSLTNSEKKFEFASLKLVESKIPSGLNVTFTKQQNNSKRNNLLVLFSITIISGLFTLLLFKLISFVTSKSNLKRKISLVIIFLSSMSLHLIVLYSFLPGLFSWDTFDNYYNAATYSFSAFVGVFYSALLIILYQVFPYEILVPVVTVLVISYVLTELYAFSVKNNVLKYYFLSCFFYFLLPANWVVSLSVGRDTMASWILFLTILKLYSYFADQDFSLSKRTELTFFLIIVCLLRQESIVYLPALLISLCFLWSKQNLKWAFISGIYMFGAVLLINQLPFINKPKIVANYHTTALVNPLGSILTQKYKNNLDEDIKSRLGPYFKNDYLIKHHQENEILPFHMGGVNHESSIEDYKKFKNASIKIIFENLNYFFENRINMFKYLFGFSDWTALTFDEYSLNKFPLVEKMKESLGFEPGFKRDHFLSNVIKRYLHLPEEYPIIFKSYLIPFAIIFISLFLCPKSSWYKKILLILLTRTLIVILTAPAGNFKYNYIIYLFSFLAIPLWVSERKKSLVI